MATNTQNLKIGMAIKNRSSAITDLRPCKRKLKEFATPLKREYYESPKAPKEHTVRELIAAGSDLANIMSSACQLTNDIHPIFRDENLCLCEYALGHHCVAPRFAAEQGIAKILQKPLPYQKDRIILRTILQLASQMITHPQTLPFWTGLIDAVVLNGEDVRAAFKVHPTRLLDIARRDRALQDLEKFAQNMRVHLKDFVADGTITPRVSGYASIEDVRDTDPGYKQGANQHYAYRNCKATIETGSRPFLHIFINLNMSDSLRPYEALMGMTITQMKVDMFGVAVTICHELSHALEQHYCDRFETPRMNDELMIETGFSLENFLLGGTYTRKNASRQRKPCIQRWPSPAMYDFYKSNGHPMEIQPLMDLGPDRLYPLDPRRCAVFLEQSFWDDSKPPTGCWKKMWLRPYMERAIDEKDFDYFKSGFEYPFMPPMKRRRLSDAAVECKRAYDANGKREVEVRWHSRKDVSEERKARFDEGEMDKLNDFWADCTKGIDDRVFLG